MSVDIPNLPGVPPLGDYAPAVALAANLMSGDAASLLLGALAPQWGIFLDGAPVVVADNVVSLTYSQEWTIADYPLEQGAFESFDKVARPFDVKLRFSAGGSQANRQALLDSIAAIAGDLNLYDVVTPEEVYQSVNIAHFDYQRSAANGVGLIQIDVACKQVRVAEGGDFSATQAPSGAAQVNGGAVQPVAATPAQVQQLNVNDVAAAGGVP